jgi:hypothetical protein
MAFINRLEMAFRGFMNCQITYVVQELISGNPDALMIKYLRQSKFSVHVVNSACELIFRLLEAVCHMTYYYELEVPPPEM